MGGLRPLASCRETIFIDLRVRTRWILRVSQETSSVGEVKIRISVRGGKPQTGCAGR